MKKKIFVYISMMIITSLNCFGIQDNIKNTHRINAVDSKSTVSVTLTNEYYNHQLYLYSDGSCVIRTPNSRGTGSYDIIGRTIYIVWDNGVKQQGSVQYVEGSLHSVSIEGVTYSKQRQVVPRRN